ncbi:MULTISPECIES: hypothetical protein [unclassified Plantactinospora]|uniref:hypothetical protein n=1 Tax=unclassified Plantactinospora TaxID=2631981 RepID=UPI0018FF0475|nr:MULTISPECIES: hypothetical protein [unclassified Plantactinospora]
MPEDDVRITLTHDQAAVLSDWLYRMIGTARFDALVDEDPAVWSPLHTIGGVLETSLPEIFAADYPVRLDAARGRLLESLGDGFVESVAERRARAAERGDGRVRRDEV